MIIVDHGAAETAPGTVCPRTGSGLGVKGAVASAWLSSQYGDPAYLTSTSRVGQDPRTSGHRPRNRPVHRRAFWWHAADRCHLWWDGRRGSSASPGRAAAGRCRRGEHRAQDKRWRMEPDLKALIRVTSRHFSMNAAGKNSPSASPPASHCAFHSVIVTSNLAQLAAWPCSVSAGPWNGPRSKQGCPPRTKYAASPAACPPTTACLTIVVRWGHECWIPPDR